MEMRISDLAVENFGADSAEPLYSAAADEYESGGFTVIRSHMGEEKYHTVVSGRIWRETTEKRRALYDLLSRLMSEYMEKSNLPQNPAILSVGLGNASVISDALGSMTVSRLITNGGEAKSLPRVYSICPGVPMKTGLDTAAVVKCIAESIQADLVIAVDALCAKHESRLLGVVQISEGGIIPGSALHHTSGEISARTMPCRVISVGVPCVIRSDVLSGKAVSEPMFVTRCDTDAAVECYASLIAAGINSAICKYAAKRS